MRIIFERCAQCRRVALAAEPTAPEEAATPDAPDVFDFICADGVWRLAPDEWRDLEIDIDVERRTP